MCSQFRHDLRGHVRHGGNTWHIRKPPNWEVVANGPWAWRDRLRTSASTDVKVPQFSVFYFQHKKCDVDALRYAFTQQVARLTANDQGMLGLSKMLAKNPQLKPVVLIHLKSEAVTSIDRDQILKALYACKKSEKNICRDVKKMLD